jgi:tetratricopeptide (TPR) repeat protein
MSNFAIAELLEDLKSPEKSVRDRATHNLWHIWFQQKGVTGLKTIRQAQELTDNGDYAQAEETLTRLVRYQPDFAEAWNRRAILSYLLGNYRKAIADCEMVVKLNPVHFGALHGLGLCHAAVGDYIQAIQIFHRALAIQPYSLENQRLILECTVRLS